MQTSAATNLWLEDWLYWLFWGSDVSDVPKQRKKQTDESRSQAMNVSSGSVHFFSFTLHKEY